MTTKIKRFDQASTYAAFTRQQLYEFALAIALVSFTVGVIVGFVIGFAS